MPPLDFKKIRFTSRQTAAITTYCRLEPDTRLRDFDRNLRAEVRDPLWLLARQWQLSEFSGEDAASPFSAKFHGIHRSPTFLRRGDASPEAYDQKILPLETAVERESLPDAPWLRIQMGRHFRKMLAARGFGKYHDSFFLSKFPFEQSTPIVADDPLESELLVAMNQCVCDGRKIYDAFNDTNSPLSLVIDTADNFNDADRKPLKILMQQFTAWFARLYSQPQAGSTAWQSDRLEYRFALDLPSPPNTTHQLEAPEYEGGKLDWYTVNDKVIQPASIAPLAPVGTDHTAVFIPSPAKFPGMPNPRFWQLEDYRINFCKIDGSPTGLIGLMLANYGLLYSNDWFVAPYVLPTGTMCEIQGIVVKDVFGRWHFVGPSPVHPDYEWHQQAFFQLSGTPARTPGRFFLPPAPAGILESPPLEKVQFVRDEMSNLVWAIEQIVPSLAGGGRETDRTSPEIPAAEPLISQAEPLSLHYRLGTLPLPHWVPFAPIQLPGNNREMVLRRAKWPGQTPFLGRVLHESLWLNEEEVPRNGVLVERTFQRTRWYDGRTLLWVGRKKSPGRGEGRSGLEFDVVR